MAYDPKTTYQEPEGNTEVPYTHSGPSGYGDPDYNATQAEKLSIYRQTAESMNDKASQMLEDYRKNYGVDKAVVDSSRGEDVDAMLALQTSKADAQFNADLLRFARSAYAYGRDEEAARYVGELQQRKNRYEAAFDERWKSEQALVDNLRENGQGHDPADLADPFVFDGWVQDTINRRLADSGWVAKGIDYAAQLIPIKNSWAIFLNGRKAANKVLGQAGYSKSMDVYKTWDRLTYAQRAAIFPQMEEAVWQATKGNHINYIATMQPFIDPDERGWENFVIGTDVVGFLAGTVAPKLVRVAARNQSIAHKALRLGNDARAGASILKEIDPNVAKAVGASTDRYLDAAASADPALSGILPGASKGSAAAQKVAAEDMWIKGAVDNFRDGLREIIDRHNPAVRAGVLTETERVEAIRKRSSDFADGVKIEPHEDGYGFTATITTRNPAFTQNRWWNRQLERARAEVDGWTEQYSSSMDDYIQARAFGDADAAEEASARVDALAEEIRKSTKTRDELQTKVDSLTGEDVKTREFTRDEQVRLTVDDTGAIKLDVDSGSKTTSLARFIGQNERTIDLLLKDAVGINTQRSYLAQAAASELKKAQKEVTDVLNPFERVRFSKRLGAWIDKGDELKRVWSIEAMRQGYGGMPALSKREISAYYGLQDIADVQFYYNNFLQRAELEFKGYKALPLVQDGDRVPQIYFKADEVSFNVPVKRFKPKGSDVEKGTSIREVYDVEAGAWIKVDKDVRARLEKKTHGFVTTHSEYVVDGKRGSELLVPVKKTPKGRFEAAPKDMAGIPERVLEYRLGYKPKVYKDINYIVHQQMTELVNGVRMPKLKAVRGFRTEKEAHIWVANQKAKGKSSYVIDTLHEMRKNDPARAENVDQAMFRGAFSQHREDDALMYGLHNNEAPRMNALEAMDMYSEYIGRHMDVDGYKDAMTTRFMKTVKQLRRDIGHSNDILSDPHDWASQITLDSSHPMYNDIKAFQDTLKMWFAVPTPTERMWDMTFTWGAKVMEKLIKPYAPEKWNHAVGHFGVYNMYKIAKKDPSIELRRLTFNYFFGMNPAQAIVQSSGMMIPFSLHPVEGMAAMPAFMALRASWGASNIKTVRAVMKAMKIEPKEFLNIERMHEAFYRSGVGQSVMVQADYGANVSRRMSYVTPRVVRDLAHKGLLFYRWGELNTRTFAWVMAHNRLMKSGALGKVGKQLTESQIGQITRESLRLATNMSPSNMAKWQQGSWGVLTQFQQVQAKYMGNLYAAVMGKEGAQWSRAEAMSSGLISMMLLGGAFFPWFETDPGTNALSLPFTDVKLRGKNWFYENMMNLFTGQEPGGWGLKMSQQEDLSAAEEIFWSFLRGGLMDVVGNAVVSKGENLSMIDFANRMSIPGGTAMTAETWLQPILDYVWYKEDPSLLKMLGPAGSVIGREAAGVGQLMSLWGRVMASDDKFVTDYEAHNLIEGIATGIGSAPSNFAAAWTMERLQDIPRPRDGMPLGLVKQPGVDELDPIVPLMRAMGFRTQIERDYYFNTRSVAMVNKTKQQDAKTIAKALVYQLENHHYETEEGWKAISYFIEATLFKYGQDIRTKQEIIDSAFSTYMDPKYPYPELQKQMLDQLMRTQGEATNSDQRDDIQFKTLEKPNDAGQ